MRALSGTVPWETLQSRRVDNAKLVHPAWLERSENWKPTDVGFRVALPILCG